ncbi:MAG: LmbE family N-acetylglucosaminyl deacetylase [Nitrospinales bacterium]|jgi:LmbE family N-acetylglucosaminyl deacetylase
MNTKFKNVLVLSPHTDDAELGAGGFIDKLIESGANVIYAAFSTASESLKEGLPKDTLVTEAKAATQLLGIKSENLVLFNYRVRQLNYHRQEILEDLIQLRNKCDYDLVLLPSLNDIHQDHQTIANEGLRAFKKTTILGYEMVWNNLSFNTTSFVVLNQHNIDKKVEALSCYQSQSSRDYMSKDFIFSLARTRGVQIGAQYAESFEVIRWVM